MWAGFIFHADVAHIAWTGQRPAMHLALASCGNLPGWEVDDAPFHARLKARGFHLSHPIWDDASVDWSVFDACLIRTTWDYTDKQEAFVAWAESTGRQLPFFNPPEIIRWNTRKTYLRDLEQAGVAITPTLFLDRGVRVNVAECMASEGWTRGFLKPVVGATARECLRFEADSVGLMAGQAHLNRLLPTEAMMLQPYLSAVEEVGELSAIFLGGSFSHAVRKIPVAGDFRVQDDFGAKDYPVGLSAEEQRMARHIVETASGRASGGELLYARVDWLTDDAGQLLLTELELVEPSLFFRHSETAADQLASALLEAIKR
jgi:glutathione synthase/RimK-type ligase-like ATP-grasp enzyme